MNVKKILCLVLTLCMVLPCILASAEAEGLEVIPYAELPAEHRAAYEAEVASALANAKARAPKDNQLIAEARGGFNGYLDKLTSGSLSVEYVLSDSMVKVGEKVSFDVDVSCSWPPVWISITGLIMDENFSKIGEIETKHLSSSNYYTPKGWTYTPSRAGYFCFILVVSDYIGNQIAFTTNTVQVSRSYENPTFDNLAIDENLGMKVSLDKTEMKVGETITAEVFFTCDVNPVSYASGWTLYDEYDNQIDEKRWSNSIRAIGGNIVTFSYTPTQEGELMFLIVAGDGEGNEVTMNTHRVVVESSNNVTVSLNKSSVAYGSPVTVNYNVQWTGAAPELEGCWCIETDEHTYNTWVDLEGMSGSASYTPEFGSRLRFFIRAKGSTETIEKYSSYASFYGTPLRDDPVYIVTTEINQSSATIGKPITATYEIDNFNGKGYFYAEWQVVADGREYTYYLDGSELPGLSGTVSFTPEFGDKVRFYVYADENDYHSWRRTGYVTISGTDKYTPPKLSLKLNKTTVKTGETVTATYEVTGGPSGMDTSLYWVIYDEDDKPLFDQHEDVSGKGTSTITVPYGASLSCNLYAYGESLPILDEYIEIPITGAPLFQPVKITASLNKSTIKSGSPISVTYKVTGGFEPYDISAIAYSYIQDGEGYWQVGNRFDLPASGTETFTPYLGNRFSVMIEAIDSEGNKFTWWPAEDVILTGAPTPGEVSLTVTMDKNEVHIGEPITATYSFDGGGAALGAGSWYAWYVLQGENEYIELESGSITELNGTLTYTPQDLAGEMLCLDLYCRNVYGQEVYWYDSVAEILEKVKERIPGDADDNGSVTAEDALLILRYGAGESVSINLFNADVNADGRADLSDALLLFQKDAGWSVTLQ